MSGVCFFFWRKSEKHYSTICSVRVMFSVDFFAAIFAWTICRCRFFFRFLTLFCFVSANLRKDEPETRVPFRESKLTHLFKNHLQVLCRTLILYPTYWCSLLPLRRYKNTVLRFCKTAVGLTFNAVTALHLEESQQDSREFTGFSWVNNNLCESPGCLWIVFRLNHPL